MFRALLCAAAVSLSVGAACGYTHDDEAFFPADYPSAYSAVTECRTGTAHSPRSFVVWASPGADQRWLAGDAFEEGDVLLRVQFDNAQCNGVGICTAMKKLAPGEQPAGGDWGYQIVENSGFIRVNGQWQDCIDCHKDCTNYSCAN